MEGGCGGTRGEMRWLTWDMSVLRRSVFDFDGGLKCKMRDIGKNSKALSPFGADNIEGTG